MIDLIKIQSTTSPTETWLIDLMFTYRVDPVAGEQFQYTIGWCSAAADVVYPQDYAAIATGLGFAVSCQEADVLWSQYFFPQNSWYASEALARPDMYAAAVALVNGIEALGYTPSVCPTAAPFY